MIKAESVEGRIAGKIKSMPRDKSFGFITDGGGSDWFFSRSFLRTPNDWDSLHQGTLVQFSSGVDSRNRRQAVDVVPIKRGPRQRAGGSPASPTPPAPPPRARTPLPP